MGYRLWNEDRSCYNWKANDNGEIRSQCTCGFSDAHILCMMYMYNVCVYTMYVLLCIVVIPLHFHYRYGQLPVVEYLVEVALCDVNCTSYDGSTPLYLACR